MKAQTEELLYVLLRIADTITHPTLANLTDSFEGWADRRGLLRQLHALERRGLLERWPGGRRKAGYRVTSAGCLRALGGQDPVVRWNRPWDQVWRLIIFDVPESEGAKRAQLRRLLRDHRWGCLQRSVWVSPDPPDEVLRDWGSAGQAKVFLTLEARPGDAERNQAIVAGAWDFRGVNRAYHRCLDLLERRPSPASDQRRAGQALLDWSREEGVAWRDALSLDPLLPAELLPRAYLGCAAWDRRTAVKAV